MKTGNLGKLKKYERQFSRRKYHGKKGPSFVIKPGTIPVMISAPHAVNHLRNGKEKCAEKFTGAIALLLHELTGCHVMYASGYTGGDPNFDPLESNAYQSALISYVRDHHIPVLIDLHGAADKRAYAIELGTAPKRDADNVIIGNPYASLKGHDFIGTLLHYAFSYVFKGLGDVDRKEIWENTIFDAGHQNTVTKSVSSLTETACVQIEINGLFRNPERPARMESLIQGLVIAIRILSRVRWAAGFNQVFKLRQSKLPVPQDKVEFSVAGTSVSDGDMVEIYSFMGDSEHVHVKDVQEEPGCIYLTNRLLHNLFGQDWTGDAVSWKGAAGEDAPVLISGRQESAFQFPIGMTKALKLDRVYFSTALYKRLEPLSKANDFIVYNRLTDSRLYIDFDERTDYRDNPPVDPPEMVILPRYFKQLLGYNTFPFNLIRREEFKRIAASVPLEVREQLEKCYQPVQKTPFYHLDEQDDAALLSSVTQTFRRLGLYNEVEVLVIPKSARTPNALSWVREKADRFVEWVLNHIIGKSDYLLTTQWSNETDDKNSVARLSPNMMSLLGVADNDKVVIRYGERKVTVRILSNPELSDYQVSVPANARTLLNMYSINDVVTVSRDMRHTFRRNSQAQTIAILGTVLAVFQVIRRLWVGVILCLVFIPLIIYFSLNEERIKVK